MKIILRNTDNIYFKDYLFQISSHVCKSCRNSVTALQPLSNKEYYG